MYVCGTNSEVSKHRNVSSNVTWFAVVRLRYVIYKLLSQWYITLYIRTGSTWSLFEYYVIFTVERLFNIIATIQQKQHYVLFVELTLSYSFVPNITKL